MNECIGGEKHRAAGDSKYYNCELRCKDKCQADR